MGASSSTAYGSKGGTPVIVSDYPSQAKALDEETAGKEKQSCLSSSKVGQASTNSCESNMSKETERDTKGHSNQIMSSDDIGKDPVPEQENAQEDEQRISVPQAQITNSKDLGKALKDLALPSHDLNLGKRIVKGNPALFKYLKTAFESVLHINDPSISTCQNSLDNLNIEFFEVEGKDRTVVGDFLGHLNFCKASYSKYKEILRDLNLKSFNDKLFQGSDKYPLPLLRVIFAIRSHWWNFSDVSTAFGNKLAVEGVVEELVQDIDNLGGMSGKDLKTSFSFESSIGTLHNLAKLHNLRQKFRDLKVVDILGNFLSYEDIPKVTMLVLMTLALIIDENQTHLLFSHESVFDLLLLLTSRAWKCSDHRYDGFSAEELMAALTGLGRNDQVKKVLVQKGALKLVSDFLTSGNEAEKESAAKLLWELSFDPENKVQIKADVSLLQTVKNLVESSSRKIVRSAQGILWVLGMDMGKKKKRGKKDASPVEEEDVKSTGHIMISYNWSDQKRLIEIRDVLQSHDFKIWMDIDNISGSTLQAMAEAVEQAEVVLVCMSEKYKESPNCRSEAEYAFSLRKPIIPLLMQPEYKPDGWLGILLGTKIFFNFSGKYPFETKMAELVKEIGSRGKKTGIGKQDGTDGPVVKEAIMPVGKSPATEPQSLFDVSAWITENNLEKFACLKSLTNEHLQFLKKLSLRAPEFYYKYTSDLLSGKVTPDSLSNLMLVTRAIDIIPR